MPKAGSSPTKSRRTSKQKLPWNLPWQNPVYNRKDYTKDFERACRWHEVKLGVKWRFVRHWAANSYAGEGKEGRLDKDGNVIDRSGGLRYIKGDTLYGHFGACIQPKVFVAKEYTDAEHRFHVHAFLSYPKGMSSWDTYFWEMYPDEKVDARRFDNEEEMEEYIVRIMTHHNLTMKRNEMPLALTMAQQNEAHKEARKQLKENAKKLGITTKSIKDAMKGKKK